MAIKSPGRKRTDPGRAYDMDLEIVDVFLRRWPALQRDAKKYLDDRRTALMGSPDRRDHWGEDDKQVPVAQQPGERARRVIRNHLRHLLRTAKEGRKITMSVAAGALGVTEDRVRKLWPRAFGHSRRAEISMAGKARTERSTITVGQLRKLEAAAEEEKLEASLPRATAVAAPRRLGPPGASSSPGTFLNVSQGTIRFNLDVEGASEALDDFLTRLHACLLDGAKTKVLANLGITWLDDTMLAKSLTEGAELQYMTLAQSLSMPWENVEEQERWTELYVALLDAQVALAQNQRGKVEAALLEALQPPPAAEPVSRGRIKPDRL